MRLRISNSAPNGSASLSLTVSKPPREGIIAVNGLDLGEGTQIAPGQSEAAIIHCAVPKSQVNVDSYTADACKSISSFDSAAAN